MSLAPTLIQSSAPSAAHAAHAAAEEQSAAAPATVGVVKWFNDQKGFGFLCDDEGRDVFVHYAVIDGQGFKTLAEGESVRYDFVDGPKGRRATRVVRDAE